jgi:hypothetical protein
MTNFPTTTEAPVSPELATMSIHEIARLWRQARAKLAYDITLLPDDADGMLDKLCDAARDLQDEYEYAIVDKGSPWKMSLADCEGILSIVLAKLKDDLSLDPHDAELLHVAYAKVLDVSCGAETNRAGNEAKAGHA